MTSAFLLTEIRIVGEFIIEIMMVGGPGEGQIRVQREQDVEGAAGVPARLRRATEAPPSD